MWLGFDNIIELVMEFDNFIYLLYLTTQTYQSTEIRLPFHCPFAELHVI